MAFLNNSRGQILQALVYENKGTTLPTALQLAAALEPGSRLLVLLHPNIQSASIVLYPIYQSTPVNRRVKPFDRILTLNEFELLLKADHREREANWKSLIQTIKPEGLPEERYAIEFDWVGPVPEAAALNNQPAAGQPKSAEEVKLLNPVGDDVFTPSVSRGGPGIAVKGTTKQAIEKVLQKYLHKVNEVLPDPCIENGDVMAGENFVFVGISSFVEARLSDAEVFKQKVAAAYYPNEPKPDIYLVGQQDDVFYNHLFFYHLDLYFNYAGKTGSGKHLFFCSCIPQPVIDELYPVKDDEYLKIKSRQLYLQTIYETVCALNPDRFEVVQIPMVVDGDRMYGYNNALVETKDGMANYYMPRYTSITDVYTRLGNSKPVIGLVNKYYLEAYDTIHQHGFNIKPVDVSVLFNGGINQALHCFVAVLERG